MNLILLEDEDFIAVDRVRLTGRRQLHIKEVLGAAAGESLRVGQVNGKMGEATLVRLADGAAELQVSLVTEPPPPTPVTLLLALPRPKMLRRVLQSITSLGVKRIFLINSYRVEKSFWGSPLLQPERLREQLLLGLEQGCDTRLPEVQLRQRFKPFVEDELPALCRGSEALVAHPGAAGERPPSKGRPSILAVGPEGGFIPYEIDKLVDCGFTPFSLGPRILRVETAVPVLLSRFLPG